MVLDGKRVWLGTRLAVLLLALCAGFGPAAHSGRRFRGAIGVQRCAIGVAHCAILVIRCAIFDEHCAIAAAGRPVQSAAGEAASGGGARRDPAGAFLWSRVWAGGRFVAAAGEWNGGTAGELDFCPDLPRVVAGGSLFGAAGRAAVSGCQPDHGCYRPRIFAALWHQHRTVAGLAPGSGKDAGADGLPGDAGDHAGLRADALELVAQTVLAVVRRRCRAGDDFGDVSAALTDRSDVQPVRAAGPVAWDAGGATGAGGRAHRDQHSAGADVSDEGERKDDGPECLCDGDRRVEAHRGLGHDRGPDAHGRDSLHLRA